MDRLTQELGAAPGTFQEKSSIGIAIDPATGAEVNIRFTSSDVNQNIYPPILELGQDINRLLLDLPDNIACEVIESGICLTGGGSCLRGMAQFLAAATKIETKVAADPIYATVNGAGKMLEARWPESVRQLWAQNQVRARASSEPTKDHV
jgi:rod shape-determining protein MreB